MAKKSIQKSIIFLMPLGTDLWVDYGGFWCQNRAMLATKWDQKSMLTSKGHFSNFFFIRKNDVFWDPKGRSWEQKSTKKPSKNGIQDGMHLAIDFWAILVDFGCQVGKQNRPKIDPKRHRKNDEKQDASWRRLEGLDTENPERGNCAATYPEGIPPPAQVYNM